MADSEFFQNFKHRMSVMGLPAPESLFGDLQTATASLGAIASAIAKLGTRATISEIILSIPLEAAGAVVAAGLAEIALAIGGLSACFYLGACIGALLGATMDVYGALAVFKLRSWAISIERCIGKSVGDFLSETMRLFPAAGSTRDSVCIANAKLGSKSVCRH